MTEATIRLASTTEATAEMASTTTEAPVEEMASTNKCPRDEPGIYPPPLIIKPQLEHRQTFIILHGRGSWAAKFGPPLLDMASSEGEKLQAVFPHAKIIFPTGPRTWATIYKSLTHQWFNNWRLSEYKQRQDMMGEGLHASCEYIHGLLREEITAVGGNNVVLWGLSQGCATSLTSLLTWDGEPFAATIGMCGWLPYGNVFKDIAGEEISGDMFSQDDGEDDPFARSDDEGFALKGEKKDGASKAVEYLREEADMEDKTGAVFKSIPVFLGHGTKDDSVSIALGREAKICLEMVDVDVRMVEYKDLGHWYSPEMLSDIFGFLKEKLEV